MTLFHCVVGSQGMGFGEGDSESQTFSNRNGGRWSQIRFSLESSCTATWPWRAFVFERKPALLFADTY